MDSRADRVLEIEALTVRDVQRLLNTLDGDLPMVFEHGEVCSYFPVTKVYTGRVKASDKEYCPTGLEVSKDGPKAAIIGGS